MKVGMEFIGAYMTDGNTDLPLNLSADPCEGQHLRGHLNSKHNSKTDPVSASLDPSLIFTFIFYLPWCTQQIFINVLYSMSLCLLIAIYALHGRHLPPPPLQMHIEARGGICPSLDYYLLRLPPPWKCQGGANGASQIA